jgi:4-hydroxybenzoate polyprenyltransferase
MSHALALWQTLRPRQWTKNLVVFAPLVFAKSAFNGSLALKSALAFFAFCFLASGVYTLNDWVDREKDRLHPEKKHRPIAAGLVSRSATLVLLTCLWSAGAVLAIAVNRDFVAVALGYLALQVCYSAVLKRLVIVDVMAIALGFILRVIGGGAAIGVQVSNWLFLCTLLLAVFLGFAKRRHELSSLHGEQLAHRANLGDYSLAMLDQMMSVVAASCILAYGLYTVAKETVEHVGSDRLKLTVPFVIYGIFRYLFLIHKRGAGGSPERVLLSDFPLIVNLLLFVAMAGWALYS